MPGGGAADGPGPRPVRRRRRGGIPLELAAPLVLGYIFATTLVALPLTLAVTQRAEALAELTERERLFRRNFTESMTGMVLLVLRGDRLEIVDANDTALQMLDDGRTPVMGRYLDRVLTGASTLRGVCRRHAGPAPSTAGAGSSARPPPREPRQGGDLASSPAAEEPTFSAQLLDVSAEYAVAGPLRRRGAADQRHSRHRPLHHDRWPTCPARVVRVNQATTTAHRASRRTQILGRPFWATIVAAVPGRRSSGRCSPSRDGSTIPGHPRGRRPAATGDPLRVVWNNDLVRDEDGTPRYAVMTGVDVTAERTTRRADGQPVPGRHLHRDHRHRQPAAGSRCLNPGAEALLGWTAEQVHGTPLHRPARARGARRAHRRSPARGVERADATLGGEGRESQLATGPGAPPTGGRRTVAMTLSGGGSQFGPQAGYLVVGRDVTEQRHGADDADGGPGEGADGGGPAAPARHREERVRLDGQPRAADAGHQHRRLHRDARRRLAGAGRPRAGARCSTPSPATAPG